MYSSEMVKYNSHASDDFEIDLIFDAGQEEQDQSMKDTSSELDTPTDLASQESSSSPKKLCQKVLRLQHRVIPKSRCKNEHSRVLSGETDFALAMTLIAKPAKKSMSPHWSSGGMSRIEHNRRILVPSSLSLQL